VIAFRIDPEERRQIRERRAVQSCRWLRFVRKGMLEANSWSEAKANGGVSSPLLAIHPIGADGCRVGPER
jgi:hypothetical protein